MEWGKWVGEHCSERMVLGKVLSLGRKQLWEPPVPDLACPAPSHSGHLLHTHLPDRTGHAGQTRAVTSVSLLYTWHWKDPTSPAQVLASPSCGQISWVMQTLVKNLSVQQRAPDEHLLKPQKEEQVLSKMATCCIQDPSVLLTPQLHHSFGYQCPWRFTQEFSSFLPFSA